MSEDLQKRVSDLESALEVSIELNTTALDAIRIRLTALEARDYRELRREHFAKRLQEIVDEGDKGADVSPSSKTWFNPNVAGKLDEMLESGEFQ
jgi:hypothetical protein